MDITEERILNSGLGVNIIDTIVYDVITRLMSDLRRIDFWQTVAQNDKFCKLSYSEIFGNVKYRLSGICNSPDSVRKRVTRLIELGLFEKYPSVSTLMLRPGPNHHLLNQYDQLEIEVQMNSRPQNMEEVQQYFTENNMAGASAFYNYNEKRGWLASGRPMNDWRLYAKKWVNYSKPRVSTAKASSPIKAVSSSLPLSAAPDVWMGFSPEIQGKYKEGKLPNGDKVYILKAS